MQRSPLESKTPPEEGHLLSNINEQIFHKTHHTFRIPLNENKLEEIKVEFNLAFQVKVHLDEKQEPVPSYLSPVFRARLHNAKEHSIPARWASPFFGVPKDNIEAVVCGDIIKDPTLIKEIYFRAPFYKASHPAKAKEIIESNSALTPLFGIAPIRNVHELNCSLLGQLSRSQLYYKDFDEGQVCDHLLIQGDFDIDDDEMLYAVLERMEKQSIKYTNQDGTFDQRAINSFIATYSLPFSAKDLQDYGLHYICDFATTNPEHKKLFKSSIQLKLCDERRILISQFLEDHPALTKNGLGERIFQKGTDIAKQVRTTGILPLHYVRSRHPLYNKEEAYVCRPNTPFSDLSFTAQSKEEPIDAYKIRVTYLQQMMYGLDGMTVSCEPRAYADETFIQFKGRKEAYAKSLESTIISIKTVKESHVPPAIIIPVHPAAGYGNHPPMYIAIHPEQIKKLYPSIKAYVGNQSSTVKNKVSLKLSSYGVPNVCVEAFTGTLSSRIYVNEAQCSKIQKELEARLSRLPGLPGRVQFYKNEFIIGIPLGGPLPLSHPEVQKILRELYSILGITLTNLQQMVRNVAIQTINLSIAEQPFRIFRLEIHFRDSPDVFLEHIRKLPFAYTITPEQLNSSLNPIQPTFLSDIKPENYEKDFASKLQCALFTLFKKSCEQKIALEDNLTKEENLRARFRTALKTPVQQMKRDLEQREDFERKIKEKEGKLKEMRTALSELQETGEIQWLIEALPEPTTSQQTILAAHESKMVQLNDQIDHLLHELDELKSSHIALQQCNLNDFFLYAVKKARPLTEKEKKQVLNVANLNKTERNSIKAAISKSNYLFEGERNQLALIVRDRADELSKQERIWLNALATTTQEISKQEKTQLLALLAQFDEMQTFLEKNINLFPHFLAALIAQILEECPDYINKLLEGKSLPVNHHMETYSTWFAYCAPNNEVNLPLDILKLARMTNKVLINFFNQFGLNPLLEAFKDPLSVYCAINFGLDPNILSAPRRMPSLNERQGELLRPYTVADAVAYQILALLEKIENEDKTLTTLIKTIIHTLQPLWETNPEKNNVISEEGNKTLGKDIENLFKNRSKTETIAEEKMNFYTLLKSLFIIRYYGGKVSRHFGYEPLEDIRISMFGDQSYNVRLDKQEIHLGPYSKNTMIPDAEFTPLTYRRLLASCIFSDEAGEIIYINPDLIILLQTAEASHHIDFCTLKITPARFHTKFPDTNIFKLIMAWSHPESINILRAYLALNLNIVTREKFSTEILQSLFKPLVQQFVFYTSPLKAEKPVELEKISLLGEFIRRVSTVTLLNIICTSQDNEIALEKEINRGYKALEKITNKQIPRSEISTNPYTQFYTSKSNSNEMDCSNPYLEKKW